jgi:hypothetical protein
MNTVFIRATEAPADEKALVLRAAARGLDANRFEADPEEFSQVPRSPFAYWTSDALRQCFVRHGSAASKASVTVVSTNPLNEDFRYARLYWEATPATLNAAWFPWAKGGAFSRYYFDIHTLISWSRQRTSYGAYIGTVNRPLTRPASVQHFFRPGLTWPRRTQGGLSLRVMPRGCIFADKGPAAFVENDDPQLLMALAAVTNSRVFSALVQLQVAFGSYEVGVIQRTPVPVLNPSESVFVGDLAHRIWSRKCRLDTRTENSHAFTLPALLQVEGGNFADCAQSWRRLTSAVLVELDAFTTEIDDLAYHLYGISEADRQRIERGFGAGGEPVETADNDDDDGDESEVEVAEVDAAPLVASLLSWSLGVAFGRFDVRLATGERAVPPEPEPFDPLPVCSPGMLTGDDGLPVAAPPSGYPLSFPVDGILVDDSGHARDVVGAVKSVFDAVFEDANARWHEAAELLGVSELRAWFARDFFEPHIKRYSRSRRKAPIYWQFGTASGSYSVWVYIHRATGDTLFRVLNDFVGPKLDHEKAKLDGLVLEAGANPSAGQRREIEQQELFVGEVQALKFEVARVAPLWRPNLEDGVILNFAPLWRLVPQSRGWQSECVKAWEKLQGGDFDWAHLAMRLWPERVVPKCIDDRSLAIAHGLEDVFWHEDDSGAWRQSRVDDATVQELIDERTSTTVKAALKDLVSAVAPVAGKGRKARGRSVAPRSAVPKPRPAAARATASDTVVDEATLRAVRAAIASVADGASRAAVLAATGLSDGDWNKVIAALLDRGEVTRSGQKRGTRYHVAALGGDG